jgi:hypothetical protein
LAADLRWYFTREITGPLRSSYGAMIHRLSMGSAHREATEFQDDSQLLEDAHRAGGIARVLRGLDPETVDHLWRAFGGEWPEELALLGDLGGLAPLTRAAIAAHAQSGTDLSLTEWLTELFRHASTVEEMELLGCIHHDARALRARALDAYLAQRRRIGTHAHRLSTADVLLGLGAGPAIGDVPPAHRAPPGQDGHPLSPGGRNAPGVCGLH